MPRVCHGNIFHDPVGHTCLPQLVSRWNVLHAFFKGMHVNSVVKFPTGLPNVFTFRHTPWQQRDTSRMWHPRVQMCVGWCWRQLAIKPHQIVDIITG